MRPRSFDETTVLERLRAAFRQYGFDGLSLDQLSEATGLNRSSLYNAFGSKEGMMRAAVDAYCADSVQRFKEAMEMRPLRDGVQRLLRVAAGLEDPVSARGCLIGNLIAERAAGQSETRLFFARKLEALEGAIREGLEHAHAEGAIAPGSDPQALAQYLIVTFQGLRLVAQAHPNPETLERSVAIALDAFDRQCSRIS
ncbi:MAG: TetR/AcrR family transcriptional regulator [Neomegalonema sp.]